MIPFLNPFSIPLDPNILSSFETGRVYERNLGHLKDYFSDQNAVNMSLSHGNPVIYKVWELEYDGAGRGISLGMTNIYPGQIGSEFYMTRGHFHSSDNGDELYVVTSGTGGLLLSDHSGNSQFMEMYPGNLYYVPGNFAHRTLNIGTEDLVFLSIWPPNIVHDYATIAEIGFPKLIMSSQTGYKVIDNPKFIRNE